MALNNLKKAAEKMGIVPRLQLAVQKTDEKGKVLGVESTGPHRLKILADAELTEGSDPMTGRKRQEFHLPVEERGTKKLWVLPLYDRDGKENYKIAKLMDLNIGDEIIVEVRKRGAKNYTSIMPVNAEEGLEDENHLPDEEEIERTLAAEAESEPHGI